MNGLKKVFSSILQIITNIFIELPALTAGIDRLIDRLEKSGQALDRRTAKVNGRAANEQALAHIIGLERWGQRRLKVALGEPLVMEEYDDYLPGSAEWTALRETFWATRQETVSLSKSLRMAGVDPHTRVRHNQFGEISLLGWLYYLNLHASIESMRIS